MEIFVAILLLCLGLVLLAVGAWCLVEGATSLARKFRVSEMVIGLSVVAVGTSAPEWIINSVSSIHEESDVVFANVIGSNIFNLYLVLGLAGLFFPIKVRSQTVWKELPYSLFLVALLFILLNDKMLFNTTCSGLNWIDGLILLVFFGIFVGYIFSNMRAVTQILKVDQSKNTSTLKMVIFLIFGVCTLGIGGELTLQKALGLAEMFSVSKKLISFLVLVPGTSLPELFTAVLACIKGRYGLAVGNVIGSNVFNVTLVLSISSLINDLEYDYSLNFDIYFLFFGYMLLFLSMFTGKSFKLDRWEAFLFVFFLAVYISFLLVRQ